MVLDHSVLNHLLTARKERGGGFLVLIDPDRTSTHEAIALAEAAEDCGVDAILVGTSFLLEQDFGATVRKIKEITTLPVIIFPGSYAQIRPEADAILFTSLLSGRNPEYLIGEQVKGAPLVKRFNLESIPTGYLLIASDNLTSVQYISNTSPIPRDKPDIATAHALATQYLGMRLVYLEAGSGATHAVPVELITKVASYIDIPIITGGGLRKPEDCATRIEAGASFIVVGNLLEKNQDKRFSLLREMTTAVHPLEIVTA